MPAISNIILDDAQSPVVQHTFEPIQVDNGKAQWADYSATTLLGRNILTIEVRKPTSKDAAHRVHISIGCPVEVTIDGVTSIDYVNSGEMWFNFAQRSTGATRKDVAALLADTLNDSSVKDVIERLVPFYGA